MKWRRWLTVLVACVAITGALGYYKYSQIRAAMAAGAAYPEPVEAVELYVARQEIWQPTTRVTAQVVAPRLVDLRAELGGRIERIGFEPGAAVSAGQLLVALDVSEERAQRDAARADVELARLDYERNQKLIRTGAAAEAARDRAQAAFEAARAAVDRLEAIIAKKTLRAPFDGRAGLHGLEPGQFLDAGDLVVRLVGADDRVWVDFTLPQTQALEIAGDRVTLYAGAGAPIEAEIIAREAVIDEQSRQLGFRAEVREPPPRLLPGSLITAEVPVGGSRNAVLVPQTAVRHDLFGTAVFLLEPAEEGASAPERARRREVTLGPRRDGLVVVTDGLRPGDRLAANGSFKLRSGSLVRAQTPQDGLFGADGTGS